MKKIITLSIITFLFISLNFFTSCDNSKKEEPQKEVSNNISDSTSIESVEKIVNFVTVLMVKVMELKQD